jgi:hypothetical protein
MVYLSIGRTRRAAMTRAEALLAVANESRKFAKITERILAFGDLNDGDVVTREEIEDSLDGAPGATEISRLEVVEFLRKLQETGIGRFVVGRRGHPSRFEWLDRPAAAQGLPSSNGAARGSSTESTIEHRFVLRPGLEIAIALPSDFSVGEAERLATFVRSLPFDVAA